MGNEISDEQPRLMAVKALQMLSKKHNLTVDIKYSPTGKWGGRWRVVIMDQLFVEQDFWSALIVAVEFAGKAFGYNNTD